jgi:hypothetical protein
MILFPSQWFCSLVAVMVGQQVVLTQHDTHSSGLLSPRAGRREFRKDSTSSSSSRHAECAIPLFRQVSRHELKLYLVNTYGYSFMVTSKPSFLRNSEESLPNAVGTTPSAVPWHIKIGVALLKSFCFKNSGNLESSGK